MLTETPLETSVRTQLQALEGFDFQDAIVRLKWLIHGVDGFQDLRRVKDGGCDGIILSERRAIACYGPNETTPKKLAKKVTNDHVSYVNNWAARYPQWRVYLNRNPGPDDEKLVSTLHPGADIHGAARIMEHFRNLEWGKKVEFARLLRVDEQLIARDFLRPLLDDLAQERVVGDVLEYRKKAPEIAEKIRANYLPDEIENEIRLNGYTFEQQATAMELLESYDDRDLSRIKATILSHFQEGRATPGPSFRDKIESLIARYGFLYAPNGDHGLQLAIRGLVFHLFAQCLIGAHPLEN